MKKRIAFWLITIVVIALLPSPLKAQCDAEKLAKKFQTSSYMPTYNKLTNNAGYQIVPNGPSKLFVIYKGNLTDSVCYQSGKDAKISTAFGNFLEIAIVNNDKKTSFFVDGKEIRNLVPQIEKDEYFRVKTKGNEVIFEFDNGKGVYNIDTKEFCRTKNSPS